MATRPASHLFYDSAATLRMVDSALDDLRVPAPHAGWILEVPPPDQPADETDLAGAELPQQLLRIHDEIVSITEELRQHLGVFQPATSDDLGTQPLSAQQGQHAVRLLAEIEKRLTRIAAAITDPPRQRLSNESRGNGV